MSGPRLGIDKTLVGGVSELDILLGTLEISNHWISHEVAKERNGFWMTENK